MTIDDVAVLAGMLILFQLKHWLIDFVMQSDAQIKNKGIYGDLTGISHSFEHALGTALVLLVFIKEYPILLIFVALLDGVLHYHIDWAKSNWGNRDISTKQFWSHLGLDQLAHQICYVLYVTGLLLI